MNPYYDEQRLRNEVIFLHSLWHQGPPQPPPNPIRLSFPKLQNLNPLSSSSSFQPYYNNNRPQQPFPHHHHQHHRTLTPFAPSHTRSLPSIAHTTIFKKPNNKRKEAERKTDLGPEWSCPDLPDPPGTTTTAWPPLKKPCLAPPPIMSPEVKEKLAALQAQNKACQAFREILRNCHDDDFEEEEDDDDDGEDLEEFEEFFIGVFMEDNELRRYYQKHFENGEFCCLVCDAIGKKKSGKKFKDCAGLVQHSMSILRTMKKLAHRAFGQAVCKVLGWDIDRLPTIVMKGKRLGLEQTQAEGEPKENDKAVSLEHCDEPAEERALGVDQSIDEGEPKENVDDDGKDGTEKLDDKVASLELGDEPVEESAVGVDQSTSEVSVASNASLIRRVSPSRSLLSCQGPTEVADEASSQASDVQESQTIPSADGTMKQGYIQASQNSQVSHISNGTRDSKKSKGSKGSKNSKDSRATRPITRNMGFYSPKLPLGAIGSSDDNPIVI